MFISKDEYDKLEKRTISYLDDDGFATAADVARVIHRTFPFAKKLLEKLVDKKKIKSKKAADRTFYYVSKTTTMI